MISFDNTEVVCHHQVEVAWINLREMEKLREPKNLTFCFTKAQWTVSAQMLIPRKLKSGTMAMIMIRVILIFIIIVIIIIMVTIIAIIITVVVIIMIKSNINIDKGSHKSNCNKSNNNEKTSIDFNSVNDYNNNGTYQNKINNTN